MRYFPDKIRPFVGFRHAVQNAEIAAMFNQAAELLEIGGENQFRVRAYRRAARGEIAAAQAGKLPRLVKLSDVRGDLHVHSDWTDGTVANVEMAEAARARGYEYMALTDHSRRVAMTHGLDPARLARQIHEIDRLNEKLKNFTILRGIEVDILRDGSLDLPDSGLAKLDIVVAAVHSHFDLPRQAQTERRPCP
jgi:DNA polymerase (family X)